MCIFKPKVLIEKERLFITHNINNELTPYSYHQIVASPGPQGPTTTTSR